MAFLLCKTWKINVVEGRPLNQWDADTKERMRMVRRSSIRYCCYDTVPQDIMATEAVTACSEGVDEHPHDCVQGIRHETGHLTICRPVHCGP